MPEQFLFTKEKGSLFNVKGWMKLLVKKSTPCYGNKNRNMQADWILNGGIEKEWDSYLDKMEKYGLSDYLAIKQKYFEQYQASLAEEK